MIPFAVCTFNLDTVIRDLILFGRVSNLEGMFCVSQLDKNLTNLGIVEVTHVYESWTKEMIYKYGKARM